MGEEPRMEADKALSDLGPSRRKLRVGNHQECGGAFRQSGAVTSFDEVAAIVAGRPIAFTRSFDESNPQSNEGRGGIAP